MNTVNLMGRVLRAPTYDERAKVLSFTLVITRPSRRPGGSGVDFVPIQAWGALGRDLQEAIEKREWVGVTGRLRFDRGEAVVSAHDIWRTKAA